MIDVHVLRYIKTRLVITIIFCTQLATGVRVTVNHDGRRQLWSTVRGASSTQQLRRRVSKRAGRRGFASLSILQLGMLKTNYCRKRLFELF